MPHIRQHPRVMLAMPLLVWPLIVRPGRLWILASIALVVSLLLLARTGLELLIVMFAHLAVDGYLRLLFDYDPLHYMLPLIVLGIVYARYFLGDEWKERRGRLAQNPLRVPLALLTLAFVVAAVTGSPFSPYIGIVGLTYHLAAMPLVFLGATAFRDEQDLDVMLWFFVALGAYQATAALFQSFSGLQSLASLSQTFSHTLQSDAWFIPNVTRLNYRPPGTTLSSGGPGLYGIIGVLVAVGLIAARQVRKAYTLLALGLCLLMGVAIFYSGVRAFWVGIVVGLVVFGVLRGVRFLPILGVLAWYAGQIAIGLTQGNLALRINSMRHPWSTLVSGRGNDFALIPSLIHQHPLGIGLGHVAGAAGVLAQRAAPEGVYGFAHNYYIAVLWEAGILGLVALLWVLWTAVRLGFSVAGDHRLHGHRAVAASIVSLQVTVTIIGLAGPVLGGLILSFAQVFWVLTGALLALRAFPEERHMQQAFDVTSR